MHPMIVSVEAISMLREGRGYTEDGYRVFVTDWMVRATFDGGRRFVLNHLFRGEEVVSEEGFSFEGETTLKDNDAKANALAARIWDAVTAGRDLDMDRWTEVAPVYGSEAYISMDRAGWFYARERMEG